MNPLEKQLKNLHGGRVLDVGTGFGGFVKMMSEAFASFDEIIGIDYAEDRIAKAREKEWPANVRFEAMDASKLAFDDSTFETAAISNSLHHLEDVAPILQEMHRVLKPGGMFVICEVFFDPAAEVGNSQHHAHHWWADVDKALGVSHHHTLTRDEIVAAAEKLGLRDVEQAVDLEPPSPPDAKETVEWVIAGCEHTLERLKDVPCVEALKEKGEALIDLYRRSGCTWDGELYLFGRK